jgi:hypothetical protein
LKRQSAGWQRKRKYQVTMTQITNKYQSNVSESNSDLLILSIEREVAVMSFL